MNDSPFHQALMLFGTKARRSALVQLVLWACLLGTLWFSFPNRITRVSKFEHGVPTPVTLPWFGPQSLGEHHFKAELNGRAQTLSIRADDCVERLELDDRTIFATEPSDCLHCGYTDFPLPADLTPGAHCLTFAIRNLRGDAWFDIKEAHGLSAAKVLLCFFWGAGAFWVARRSGYPAWVGWPVALAALLALQYLDVTGPWVRQHDVEGHREYVEHLANERSLPSVRQGWETWQPPLYYVVAAAWKSLFSGVSYDDPFRPVQFLAAVLYLALMVASLPLLRRCQFAPAKAVGALGILGLLPAHLFFSGRISNDVLLPILGGGVMLVTAEFAGQGERLWLWWLAGLLPLSLAAKGSSLGIAAGALMVVLYSESRRAGWVPALARTYVAAIPTGCWLLLWWGRNSVQTGDPLYVNAALPDELRVFGSVGQRLLSFDTSAFLNGAYYYDAKVRSSIPMGLLTSALYGEYGWQDYGLRWSGLLRWGFLGLLFLLLAGAVMRPRAELRSLWLTCLCLVFCHALLIVTYALQYPFACNRDMRFFGQVFVPAALLWGLGVGHFWSGGGLLGRVALGAIAVTFLAGLAEFYLRLLF